MSTVKIIGAIVDTKRITLYKHDGTTITIQQGTEKVPFIVETVIPAIKADGYYEGELRSIKHNPYADYESKSSVVKFFSIARKKLANLFSAKTAEPTEVGSTTTDNAVSESTDDGLSEVMAHAVPASDSNFDSDEFGKPDINDAVDNCINDNQESENTLIAVVGDKVIPDAQRLRNYVFASNITASSEGLDNFFKRIANVIDDRLHSVEDLLVFLERAELPISNDGRIICYKALDLLDSKEGRIFVDSHTGMVKQRVGSIVETAVNNVDPDRRRDCSNGLHLARRSYLSSFPCNTCTLCYLDPADVIAVPKGTGSKIRVTKYEILAELTEAQYLAVKNSGDITKAEGGKELLNRAINNSFPAPKYKTYIAGKCGNDITYTVLGKAETKSNTSTSTNTDAITVEEALKQQVKSESVDPVSLDDVAKAPVTEPKKTSKPKAKPKAKIKTKTKAPTKAKGESPRAQIAAMLTRKKPSDLTEADITKLKALKKQAKKGWGALNVGADFVEVIDKK